MENLRVAEGLTDLIRAEDDLKNKLDRTKDQKDEYIKNNLGDLVEMNFVKVVVDRSRLGIPNRSGGDREF